VAFLAARRAAQVDFTEVFALFSAASVAFLCVPLGSTFTGIMTISEPGAAGECIVMASG
jgi:hypothetical protein